MTEDYREYLKGEQWKHKRLQRLKLNSGRCSVCSTNKDIQVHHLTYERIFNEDMADLLPLCCFHHEAAEALIKRKLLTRKGNVLFLATETVRMILSQQLLPRQQITPRPKNLPLIKRGNPPPVNIRTVEVKMAVTQQSSRLLSEQWFIDGLRMKRKSFHRLCRRKLKHSERLSSDLKECFDLYANRRQYPKPGNPNRPMDYLVNPQTAPF